MTAGATFQTIAELCKIARKQGHEELRLTVDEMQALDGRTPRWCAVKPWFRGNDGKWRPGKGGITFRKAEIRRVIEALERAERILNDEETVPEPGEHSGLRAEETGFPF